ncbi:MAG: hypothetical protein ACLTZH_03065 [Subdoligranulum sp.]
MQDNCLALCDNTWVFYFLAAPGIFVGADVCAIPHDKHQKFFRSCLTDTSFSHIPGLFFCANTVDFLLGQHRTIPALRLKHRSGSCGTASALPKCSIRHPVLSALLAWHLPHLARRIGT